MRNLHSDSGRSLAGQRIENPRDFLADVADKCRYEFFSLMNITSPETSLEEAILCSNWPEEILNKFGTIPVKKISGFLSTLDECLYPYDWFPEQGLTDTEKKPVPDFFEILTRRNLMNGVVVPVHGMENGRGAVIFGNRINSLTETEFCYLHSSSIKVFDVVTRSLIEDQSEHVSITNGERQLIQGLCEGMSTKKLAAVVECGELTVHLILKRLMTKLDIQSYGQLILLAHKNGWVNGS